MKQHLPTPAERMPASAPAHLRARPPHRAASKLRSTRERMIDNAGATRHNAHRTHGIWHDTAGITAVFAPYHQRPKDAVT